MSLRRSFAIARNECRVLRRDPTPLVILIAMPLLVVPIFRATFRAALQMSGHQGVSGAEFAVPGQAVEFLFFLAPAIGFTFFREHGWGTWSRLRASPATSTEIMLGKAAPMFVLGALQLAVLFSLGRFGLDLHVRGSGFGVALVSFALLACVVTLGVALTAVLRTNQQLNAIGYLSATVCGAIGGALVPLATLPAWARHLSPATPQYWAMRGYNSEILDGRGLAAVWLPVVVLFAFATAFALIALTRFRFSDEKVGWA
jgi:ABC-2 type transport system permease protein